MAADKAIRYFPAQQPGNCALCGRGYERLTMVAFFPRGQISHLACIQNPPKPQPTRKSDPKLIDFLGKRIEKAIKPGNIPKRYQIACVEFVDAHKGRALIADDMGLGKTVEVLLWLALHPDVRPVVLVVPNSVKLNWPVEIARWLPDQGNSVFVISGSKPSALPPADFYVLNFDIAKYWIAELRKVGAKCVVADECHNLQNPSAQRTQAILGDVVKPNGKDYIARNVPHLIATSGTPITNRPAEFYPVLARIVPNAFGTYWDFVYRYANAHKRRIPYGPRRSDGSRAYREILDISGASNISELHQKLIDHAMIRRIKSEVASELPEKLRAILPVEIQNRKEYERAEADFLAWLESTGAEKGEIDRAAKAEAIVRINALKRLAATGKLANVIEWCKDFLATGEKLVVFCHHRSVGQALLEAMEQFKPAKMFGQMTAKQLQAEKERFQTEESCRLAIGSHKKAGEGITLHAASNMAVIELPWTPGKADQTEDRIHRIGQRRNCTIYYLLASGTVEEMICAKLDDKRKVLAGVLDNRAVGADESLLDGLLAEMAKRAEIGA